MDDEPSLCDLVEHALERKDLEVSSVHTGGEAIEWVEKKNPDLILLDIELPDIDGWEVLDRLSEKSSLEDIPVAMLTHHHLTVGEIGGEKMENLFDYIEKPFGVNDLLERIENLLQKVERIYQLKERIIRSSSGDEEMTREFLVWSRAQIIHERSVDKLEEIRNSCYSTEKAERIESLISEESRMVEKAKREKRKILKEADLEDLEN